MTYMQILIVLIFISGLALALVLMKYDVREIMNGMKGGNFSYLGEDISEGNIASYSGIRNTGRVYLPMPLYASIANLPPLSTVYGHPLPLVIPPPGPLSQPMYIEHNAGYTCSKSCCPSSSTCVGGCVCKPYIWV